jgi:hypothetical protein
MLLDATKLYDEASAALRAGDTVTWATKQKEAEEKVREASKLEPATAATTTTTPTTTAPAPTTTAGPPP